MLHLVIHLRRTTSACYRLGYCHVLVNRVYKPKCEETSLDISSMLRHRDLNRGGGFPKLGRKSQATEQNQGNWKQQKRDADWHLKHRVDVKYQIPKSRSFIMELSAGLITSLIRISDTTQFSRDPKPACGASQDYKDAGTAGSGGSCPRSLELWTSGSVFFFNVFMQHSTWYAIMLVV